MAAQKKPKKIKQYEANFKDVSATLSDAVKAVERLELDLKRIKNKLNCFCHAVPHGPTFGPGCKE